MIGFILADLRRFKGGAFAVIMLVALSVALSVAVTLQERAVRLGSARAAEKFDLVVGAAGSETQLALSAVFLQPSPLPLMSGAVLEKLARDPRVSFAAPVGFGDSADGRPVVGTTTALVAALSPTLAEGTVFTRLGEAVVGADVPMRLGAEIKPMHGAADTGGHTHVEIAYKIRGRMAPTGTAWDRAILVPIQAVWQLHGMGRENDHGHTGEEAEGSAAEDHDHEIHVEADAALDEEFGAGTRAIPAVLVKPKTMGDAYRLRQEYRSETTLAVFPAEVLTRLYATLGDARSLLLAIAIGTQAIVVAAILLVTIMHVGARRRQIGALRAFGAPRQAVFAIVWGELFLLLLSGCALGIAIGYGAAQAVSATLAAATAVHMPVEFARADLSLAIWFMVVAVLVSIVPALSALRLSPAAALRA
ncbi:MULTISPECIES: ABC transporter permease [unclassified Shinella]|uniref:ABC transporter permease n=1 Tax=unclassified Shinella TaxID=2643062 RepID=UPI0003C5612B|nr:MULTISPECIES: ABC transporter permease [unclassified Shinella]EYR82585.1 putative transmembrane transporter component [Shinella sp. DD12]MCO5149112.1 ABC transporter permease [Shinella sp.]MDC7265170.1 ABC transporter permease [Shinella sp. HY16]MDC7272067.1 ABC transporter permease [Shinella sp. YZ44]